MGRKRRKTGKLTTSSQQRVLETLAPILQSKGALTAEYRKRNSPYTTVTIHPADEGQYLAQGWEVQRRGKRRLRVRHLKDHGRALEDRAWCLFYRMGYPEIGGTRFVIRYHRADHSIGEKYVDLFAKDDETVIFGECKSRETRGRRSLQKDLHETESLQGPLSKAIRSYYGQGFKPKIIWLYFTSNIIWSEPDLDRARAINVRVVSENEFYYFEAFIKHLGPASRFQFLAEFLQGQAIPGLSNIKVPATKGKLGKHVFYSFITTPSNLVKISFINHLALNHPDGRPAYQRMINPTRIRAIGQFIKSGGYFPTNLLVNFTEGCRFDQISNKENSDPNIKFGWLYLPNKYKSAWIIDGQHRLYGFSHLDREEQQKSSLFVVAFDRMDTTTEADLFITINHKQKSVPKSVLVALQSDLKWGSSDAKERVVALSAALVKALNSDPTSPFFQRFVVQGIVPKGNQNLTIPEAVNGLVRANILGRVGKTYSAGYLSGATDEDTINRVRKILNGYFNALRDAHPSRWEGGKAYHIAVNPSVRAHLQLITEMLRYFEAKESFDVLTASDMSIIEKLVKMGNPVFSFIETAPEAALNEKFARKFGEGGVREYFFSLCELVRSKFSDFGSADFVAHLARKADQRIVEANQSIIDLEKTLRDYVTYVLKKVYGTKEMKSGEKAYWELGVESAKAKEDAYKAQQAAPVEKRLPKEAYLHLLDLMKIVRQKENWLHFQDVFNIPMAGEKGKTYYLSWIEQLNELRRIPAHASSLRTYDEDDYAFLSWLKNEFYGRLEQTDFRDTT